MHQSKVRFGSHMAEGAPGGASGPVRVSYFDPETGEPLKRKPKPRRAQPREESMATMRTRRVKVTAGGKEYPDMKSASLGLGVSRQTLTKARREGWDAIDGVPVSLAEPERR